jgi:pyruvate kinase
MTTRSTKLVCTLGPACGTPEQIEALAVAGMTVARINMSHGSTESYKKTISMLHELNAKLAKNPHPLVPCIGILVDTQGAEIRTGDLAEPLELKAGQEVVFTNKKDLTNERPVIWVNYEHFARDVGNAERILVDNGEITFELVSVQPDGGAIAKAMQDGVIGSRRHVNLPGVDLDMPSVSEKDWKDMEMAIEEKADFVALSFIRTGAEVEEVGAFLKKKGSPMQMITKIETRQAVENIHEIIAASHGIMVARGDLGAEIPFERVPAIQDEIVALCRAAGKPVIVATHMLESMIVQPMPTRAEATDIAHAVLSRTDSTMLSGETAKGKHPLAAVDAMSRVIRATEEHLSRSVTVEAMEIHTADDARAEAAVTLAKSTNAKAIVAITRTGKTARAICRYRPHVPVIACTPDVSVQHQLQLSYGALPLILELQADHDATIDAAMKARVFFTIYGLNRLVR